MTTESYRQWAKQPSADRDFARGALLDNRPDLAAWAEGYAGPADPDAIMRSAESAGIRVNEHDAALLATTSGARPSVRPARWFG